MSLRRPQTVETDRFQLPLVGRPVLAAAPGSTPTMDTIRTMTLPKGCSILTGHDMPEDATLPEPWEEIPVLPREAAYAGQIIAVVLGPDWSLVDAVVPQVPQHHNMSRSTEDRIETTFQTEVNPAHGSPPAAVPPEDTEPHIVEGFYRTELQLHAMDVPLWAEVRRESAGWTARLPAQWPGAVRRMIAALTGAALREITLHILPVQAPRDGALHLPVHLAALATGAVQHTGRAVRVALRGDQQFLSGGRSPARIHLTTRLTHDGTLEENTCEVDLHLGAFPTFQQECIARLTDAAATLYQVPLQHVTLRMWRTSTVPLGTFEGLATAQITFAREVHYNRLAALLDRDPLEWRMRAVRQDWRIISSLATELAEESDFSRRYAANELVRKRRLQLPQDSSVLKGIGCAIAEQASGFLHREDRGAVTVRLEADGMARLLCSVPTPNPRLRTSWRSLVAQVLQLDLDQVILETATRSDQANSGPRIFSRGVTLIPRAILSCCEAIQRQRFREPLPIQIRRVVRMPRSARNPGEALRSIGGATVEVSIIPATMRVQVRSVTMVVAAGRILDRGAAEAELRRGIYQALSWALHEGFPDPARLGDATMRRGYLPDNEGITPRIRVVLLPAQRKEGPAGLGELPFLSIPAALTSALSQATGLFLDSVPTRTGDILRMLRDE